MKTSTICAILLLASTQAIGQTSQWTVVLTPPPVPLPTGMCMAVQLTIYDPVTKDVPRNPQGYRISMADFDLSVNGGTAAAGRQIDANHYEVCGCPGGAGATASVTARYPAQSLPAVSRVPGVSFQQSANFTLAPPKGPVVPPACIALASQAPGAQAALLPAAPASPPTSPASSAAPAPAQPVATAAGAAPPASSASPAPVSPLASTAAPPPPALATPSGANPAGIAKTGVPTPRVPVAPPAALPAGTPAAVAAAPPPPASTQAVAPKSTPPVAAPALSGKYLITLTGIRAYQATMDDLLSRDGMGDEVYASTYVRLYDRRTGDLLEAVTRESATYGDVANFGAQRLQAGTRSQTGGIQDGDMIPGPALIATRSAPAQASTFPMRLWEGPLTDGVDALVMSPSLWEQDVGNAFYAQWLQFQQAINTSLFVKQGVQDQISEKKFGPVVFGLSGVDANTTGASVIRTIIDVQMMAGGVAPFLSMLSTTADRPIGIVQNGRDMSALPNSTVVLTREIIEAALAQPALGLIASPVANMPQVAFAQPGSLLNPTATTARIGVTSPKPGVMVITLQEKDITGTQGIPERPAIYQMYIQVERVP